jgi:hypothetical protein
MITDITPGTLNAAMLGMFVAEMGFPKTDEGGYATMREEAVRVLGEIEGLSGIDLPLERQAFSDQEDQTVAAILEGLALLRSRVNGEVLPLTFFMLSWAICRGLVFAAFQNEEQWKPHRELIRICLRELGLEEEAEIALVESRARAAVEQGDSDETTFLRTVPRAEAMTESLKRIFERTMQRWSDVSEINTQFSALMNAVTGFRHEAMEGQRQILAELAGLRGELAERMVAAGVAPAAASLAADPDSPGFMDRILRWSQSEKARDALEAAMWAALDFVPAGTGVKLGLKVLQAVRKSLR